MSLASFPIRILAALLLLAASPKAQGFKYWDPADTSKTPRLISQTGFFANLAVGRKPIAAANLFEVNSALWSDGSHKQRWFVLKPNKSIGFKEKKDYFDYPDSAVFVKNFAIDTVEGDATSRVLWETRFLVLKKEAADPDFPDRKEDRWYGFTYKWRPSQKEADLVPDTGLKATLRVYPNGRNQPSKLKKWIFPARESCVDCHHNGQSDTLHARSVLGFFAAQLNRPSPVNPAVNQLQDFFNKGLLKGARPANWADAPRWYAIDSKERGASLDIRARSYLGANCSGCHSENGFIFSRGARGPNFEFHEMKPKMELGYMFVGWDRGLPDVEPVAPSDDPVRGVYVITPGYPQKSVALHRQKVRNSLPPDSIDGWDPAGDQMPPLATFEVHTAALAVLAEWVEKMPQIVGVIPPSLAASPLQTPSFRGRTLVLPGDLARGNTKVTLLGLDGREVPLVRQGPDTYALPGGTPSGVYVIRVGRAAFTRSLW